MFGITNLRYRGFGGQTWKWRHYQIIENIVIRNYEKILEISKWVLGWLDAEFLDPDDPTSLHH